MNYPSIPRVLLYALGLTLVVALAIAATTSTVAFSPYNPAWDGTADVRSIAEDHTETTVALDSSAYPSAEANETVAVVMAPSEPVNTTDARRIHDFVDRGGTLVIADNFGPDGEPYGNGLLRVLGSSARFDGTLLRDERSYFRGPALPVATNVTEHPLTTDVNQLTVNYGTAVEPNNATVLVRTSSFAYLDRAGTGDVDDADELRAYPVATVESVGEGHVIAVGDPSLFINTMLEQPDNERFVRNLFVEYDRSILDYSHAESQPPLVIAHLQFQKHPILQALGGGLGLLVVWRNRRFVRTLRTAVPAWLGRITPEIASSFGIAATTDDQNEPPAADHEALARYLRDRHPSWDSETIDRVIAGTLRSTDTHRDDD